MTGVWGEETGRTGEEHRMYLTPAAATASRFLAVLPHTPPKPHALDYAKSGPETPRPALPNVRRSILVLWSDEAH
jgi:hypothetical protein